MKFTAQDQKYLSGEDFSSDVCLRMPTIDLHVEGEHRIAYLRNLVRGKRVLHVGCVDHLPLIEAKRAQGLWLHEVLDSSAKLCVGLDIQSEGCTKLNEMGFANVYYCDILRDPIPQALRGQKFDYLILGEMIEHVDDPVQFLKQVREKFSGIAAEIITTTPNVFRFQNILATLRQTERINSDHRYWFSPYTLAKVFTRAGYKDLNISVIWYMPSASFVTNFIKNILARIVPLSQDCLIIKAKIDGYPKVD